MLNTIKVIEDAKIVDVKRNLNMIMFTFLKSDKEYYLHIQSFFRLFDEERLVLTSEDLYYPSKRLNKKEKKRFKWSNPDSTFFDDLILMYKEKLRSSKVTEVLFHNEKNDFKIFLENNIKVEILCVVSNYDNPDLSENFRFFGEDINDIYITV